MHTYTYVYMQKYTCTHTYTHKHTRAHTHTHIHITYTQKCTPTRHMYDLIDLHNSIGRHVCMQACVSANATR